MENKFKKGQKVYSASNGYGVVEYVGFHSGVYLICFDPKKWRSYSKEEAELHLYNNESEVKLNELIDRTISFSESGLITKKKLISEGFKENSYGLNMSLSKGGVKIIHAIHVGVTMIMSDRTGIQQTLRLQTFEQIADFANLIKKHAL